MRVAAIAFFVVGVELIAVWIALPKTAFSAAGACCNGVTSPPNDCSGCFKFPGVSNPQSVELGNNNVFWCQDYVNPIQCDDTDKPVCAPLAMRMHYTDANCSVGGRLELIELGVTGCLEDGCD
jgi:hypothetical protein